MTQQPNFPRTHQPAPRPSPLVAVIGLLAVLWLAVACSGDSNPVRSAGLALAAEPGAVLFASDRGGAFQLYVMRPDGSRQTQLTGLSGDARQPRWSPDGLQAAFLLTVDSDGDGRVIFGRDESALYVLDVASGALKKLLAAPMWQNAPLAWSPDSRRIALALLGDSDGDGQRGYLQDIGPVVVVDVAGGQVRDTGQQATWGGIIDWANGAAEPGRYLLYIGGLRAQAALQRLDLPTGQVQPLARAESFAVSPDRRRVAYGLPRYEPFYTLAPVEQSLSGGDTVSVITLPATFAGLTADAWSPAGDHMLAATFDNATARFDYAVVSLTDGPVATLGESLAQSPQSATWSPDGQQIIFSAQQIDITPNGAQRVGNADLFLMPAIGAAPLQLTRYRGNNIDPAWKVAP